MMKYTEAIERYENYKKLEKDEDALKDYLNVGKLTFLEEGDYEEGKRICFKIRDITLANARTRRKGDWYSLYMLSLKYLARYFNDFDSYLLYLERYRDPKDQFYLPRRTQLRKLGIVQGFQDILDDKLDVLTVSLPPGTGKSSISHFFTSYYCGLHPDKCNVYSSYSGKMTDLFHRASYEIITNQEYAWREIFPSIPIEAKSDKDQYINLGKFKPFKTLTCRSIDASTTGVTRAEGLLLADDLVEGIEEAMSLERLDKLYTKYLADLYTRRKEGCKVIMIGTRWSVHDPIGHLIVKHENDPRARFIAVSCFDENGESNFEYKYGKGFSTVFFKDMQLSMGEDDVTFRCMFLSDPIEREGLLYHKEDLQYYLGGLPCDEEGKVKEPDAILGVCDTKDTGTDYNCLLVGYKYGQKIYLEDVVYDNGSPYVLDELNADCLIRNNVQMCQFESNKEGSRTGNDVQKIIDSKGGRCSITKKYTTQNKETKILVNSDWVKKHILFKDKAEWTPMYKAFMKGVFSYVQMGKNKHDDGVDALAMFALYIQSFEGAQVDIMDRRSLGF